MEKSYFALENYTVSLLRTAAKEQHIRIFVIMYLNIKNAFNAINHRAIFHVLEAKGSRQKT